MKVIIQRTTRASCIIDGNVFSSINHGLVLLVGFGSEDAEVDLEYVASKIVNMRIFNDLDGKMNKSVIDVNGSILSISQFTLYGDCLKGNRPSFINALNPQLASEKYDEFNTILNSKIKTETGVFGADMKLDFVNDGPVTIVLEK